MFNVSDKYAMLSSFEKLTIPGNGNGIPYIVTAIFNSTNDTVTNGDIFCNNEAKPGFSFENSKPLPFGPE